MQSELPFFDSPEDALRAAVQVLGGAKQVGAGIWPDLSPDNAARRLLDALSDRRPEKLDLTQVMRILLLAKAAGCHGPMQWICGEVGYEARPVTRPEEMDRLTLVVEQSTKTLASAISALERIQRVRAVN